MKSRFLLMLLVLSPLVVACSAQNEGTPPAAPAAIETPAAPVEPTVATPEAPETPEAPNATSTDAEASNEAAAPVAITPPSGPVPVEGQDYVVIPNGQPFAPLNGKVEVVEVFGYTCPGCAQFEPVFSAWKKKQPADVRITPVAAAFGGYWDPYARAFYAAETLGVLDKSHGETFNAVHVARSLPVQGVTPEQFGKFFERYGVDAKTFASTMQSFGVESKLNRARQFAMRSQVQSTPSLIVNGKYLVNVNQATGYGGMLNTVEHLVARERAAGQ